MQRKEGKSMKKILISILLATVMFTTNVNAAVERKGLADTIKDKIELFSSEDSYKDYITKLKKADLSKYQESDNKINVYIFQGETCSYCLKAITYFSSIISEYGDYMNVYSYEVWKNADNAKLMEDVAKVFDETADGVPYIVIGNKTFVGYSETMDTEIETQIKATYDSSDKYDVMNNLGSKLNGAKETNNSSSNNGNDVLLWLILITSVTSIIVFNVKINNLKEELFEKLEGIKNEEQKSKKR